MTSSYNRSLERFRSSENRRVEREANQRTEAARIQGNRVVSEVEKITSALEPFSQKLGQWKEEAQESAKHKGKLLYRQGEVEDAQRLYELTEELKITKEEDTRFQEIKAEILRLEGPSVYPQADRYAKLSPWQKVGYTQEGLRKFGDRYESALAYEMANSEKVYELEGVAFTPKELHENNITDPILKDAALRLVSQDLQDAAELDKFSPEMLKLAGTSDIIEKVHDAQLNKYRTRYNIESSANTRGKALLEWQNSAKTGDDIYRYLLINGNTVNKDGSLIGNAGAWSALESQLTQEGIALDDPDYASRVLDTRIPDALATKLGVKKGTTFAEHWPTKSNTLRLEIKQGIKKKIDQENDFLKAAGTELTNEFIKEARQGDLSTQQVNEYKRKYAQFGLTIPDHVNKYETVSMRDEREDKQQIEAIMAANGGSITHSELDQFHPKAALDFREKATRFEKAALENFGAEKKIKASLDTVFIGMGVKANEKTPAYIEALTNAKADYAKKYNQYIAMGYSPEVASYEALHAKGVKDPKTGELIPDSIGVIAEIKANEATNKYVVIGQSIEKELEPGRLRVARIATGKEEIKDDPNIIFNGTIGGDYGQKQINSIKQNIEKYGVRKGLQRDKGAIQYYKGLARGRDDNWMGLVDAQLKANGHEGLWGDNKPEIQTFMDGIDENGKNIVSPEFEGMRKQIAGCTGFPNQSTAIYQDGIFNQAKTPTYHDWFNEDFNLSDWLKTRMSPLPGVPPFNPNAPDPMKPELGGI